MTRDTTMLSDDYDTWLVAEAMPMDLGVRR
jgi:hypothetical protein